MAQSKQHRFFRPPVWFYRCTTDDEINSVGYLNENHKREFFIDAEVPPHKKRYNSINRNSTRTGGVYQYIFLNKSALLMDEHGEQEKQEKQLNSFCKNSAVQYALGYVLHDEAISMPMFYMTLKNKYLGLFLGLGTRGVKLEQLDNGGIRIRVKYVLLSFLKEISDGQKNVYFTRYEDGHFKRVERSFNDAMKVQNKISLDRQPLMLEDTIYEIVPDKNTDKKATCYVVENNIRVYDRHISPYIMRALVPKAWHPRIEKIMTRFYEGIFLRAWNFIGEHTDSLVWGSWVCVALAAASLYLGPAFLVSLGYVALAAAIQSVAFSGYAAVVFGGAIVLGGLFGAQVYRLKQWFFPTYDPNDTYSDEVEHSIREFEKTQKKKGLDTSQVNEKLRGRHKENENSNASTNQEKHASSPLHQNREGSNEKPGKPEDSEHKKGSLSS